MAIRFPNSPKRKIAWKQQRLALGAGVCVALASIIWLSLDTSPLQSTPREWFFDQLLRANPQPPRNDVVVIDIDRDSLAARGRWPWRRRLIATLLDAVRAAEPAAVGLDIVLSGTGDAGEDDSLAASIGQTRPVLATALDPDGESGISRDFPVVAIGKQRPLSPALEARALAGPPENFRRASPNIGIVSLPTDESGRVRCVPLLAVVGDAINPGFALEVVRNLKGNSTPQLIGETSSLRIGDITLPLAADALLRVRWTDPSNYSLRTIPAHSVLSDASLRERLRSKVVLIGSSAPEAGGLRPTAMDPFTADVQIQADAVLQLLAGTSPYRPKSVGPVEILVAVAFACAGIALGLFAAPLPAAALILAALAALWLGASLMLGQYSFLFNTLPAAAALLLVWQAVAMVNFAITRRSRVAIERRFARHLSPAVVQKIIDNPQALQLKGEERSVTALFTDIEGFTALTDRIAPVVLIALLNEYIDITASIVTRHGGMVDKIVGDAVHALFNAPIDLENHIDHAIDCAIEIIDATEAFRKSQLGARSQFGRTRIGVESGVVVVGEIGSKGKLDYTAHGAAMNLASRLEQANKRFGTDILVGPTAVAGSSRHTYVICGHITAYDGANPIPTSTPVRPIAAPGAGGTIN